MSRGQLESITIEGYKSIRHAEIQLRSLNVLIGANGAGKSNFISLFALVNAIVERRLQGYSAERGADSFLYFGRKRTPSLSLRFVFEGGGTELANIYNITLTPAQRQDTLVFENEKFGFWDKGRYPGPVTDSAGGGHLETQIHQQRGAASWVRMAIEDWKLYHFHDTSSGARMKQIGALEDNRFLRPDASNLAAFLYWMQERQPAYYAQIIRTIQQVAPFFEDFALEPRRLNPNTIQLEWREKGSDAYFNAHSLSDGTLRFICLATLLLQPELPSVVIIDEPELGLHPYAITLLVSMLRSAAARTQVIVSTQSVPLINQLSPEDIIVVEREDEQSVFKRLDVQDLSGWLEEYGLGDLWEKNVIGGRPR